MAAGAAEQAERAARLLCWQLSFSQATDETYSYVNDASSCHDKISANNHKQNTIKQKAGLYQQQQHHHHDHHHPQEQQQQQLQEQPAACTLSRRPSRSIDRSSVRQQYSGSPSDTRSPKTLPITSRALQQVSQSHSFPSVTSQQQQQQQQRHSHLSMTLDLGKLIAQPWDAACCLEASCTAKVASADSGKHFESKQQQQKQLAAAVAAWNSSSTSSSSVRSDVQARAPSPHKPKPPPGNSSSSYNNVRPGVQLRHSLPAAAFTAPKNTAAAPASLHTAVAETEVQQQQHASADSRGSRASQQQEQQQRCSTAQPAAADISATSAPRSMSSTRCSPIAIAKHCPEDLQPQTWQPVDFVQTRQLYEGKIALVVEGYHAASRRRLALKVYNRSALDVMERFQLAREVCLHMRCCHPFIATLYAAYKDSRHIYLVMELAPKGNLYQMLMTMRVPQGQVRRLPEREAVTRIISPLLTALQYLHQQGIIHRDIKLENVLLSFDGTIKLADFGLSIDTHHEPANTRLGTQGYFAPEVLALPLKASPFEGKSPHEAAARPSYNSKADVWSAGVVCYEVLTGRAPFAADNPADVLKAILHRNLIYPSHLSPQAVNFLQAALTRSPTARATAQQLLKHDFIRMYVPGTAQQCQ